MSKLRCHIAISLDGFVAGPNQSEQSPLGEGGDWLHGWMLRWPPSASPTAGRGRGERETVCDRDRGHSGRRSATVARLLRESEGR